MFTETQVQASPYTVIRMEPVDVLVKWDGGTREVLPNVTLVWKSTDGTRQTFRTENGNVRVASRTGQRHNGHNYRGGVVELVVHRETGKAAVAAGSGFSVVNG